MSDHPSMFGFGAALEGAADHPLIYTDNRLVGANPNQLDGCWATQEEALMNFATQFAEMAHAAHHQYLFVRRPPTLMQEDHFEGGTGWRMIGRFSIGKLKEKNGG